MTYKLYCLLLLVFSLTITVSYAQTKPLTNDDIVQMVKAGFDEEMCVKTIHANETNFDVSVGGLIALKGAGVGQKLIDAMLEAQARKRAAQPPTAPVSNGTGATPTAVPATRYANAADPQDSLELHSDGTFFSRIQGKGYAGKYSASGNTLTFVLPNGEAHQGRVQEDRILGDENRVWIKQSVDSLSVNSWPAELAGMYREVGIYYKQDGKFVQLYGRPVVASQTGGFLKSSVTMGMSKIRSKGQVPGKHAQLQVPTRQPDFYFYMAEGQIPDEFVVVRMEEKGDRREFQVGSFGGAAGGMSTGLELHKVSQVIIERVVSHVFRVRPDRELEDGEYGFLGSFVVLTAGMAGGGEKVYDFGIHMKKK